MNYLNKCSNFYFEKEPMQERCYSTNVANFCANKPARSANDMLLPAIYDPDLAAVFELMTD